MAKKRSLNVVGQGPSRLGLPTIMDRALAASYGADYVHLAAFSIDVDRAFSATDELAPLPFGWEVRLTEAFLLERFDPTQDAQDQSLLEDACLSILESRPQPPPLGGQLAFAVFTAVQRGLFPAALAVAFESWPKPPLELAQEVAEMARDVDLLPRLCAHCLALPLDPPLVQPVREALAALGKPPIKLA